jgi:intron-binding protein aquarius|tara:strand:- start:932 stop:1981 length:1050 start_codon:yes stop_codon:yes gene_type:complete
MEEAAQVLEVETLIPLMLQTQTIETTVAGGVEEKVQQHVQQCRLKRVVLIGDHNQLPPVVQNAAFQSFSHLDQSLFTRFVRLGVPNVLLNAQGRARPSIADLYRWRYATEMADGSRRTMGDLAIVDPAREECLPQYMAANSGLAYEFQAIDVQDYSGRGESTPRPFFYQNLGEAEYVVCLYRYLRLLGVPAESIVLLTTYNGQVELLNDVLRSRCAPYPYYGLPKKVSTVDKFQGQQGDIVLLSLVRTRSVGHLRDVRRLIVALSRARLGLYVFGRLSVFSECFELRHAFGLLAKRPSKLMLVPGERCPTARSVGDKIPAKNLVEVADVAQMGSIVQAMEAKLEEQQSR